MLAVFKLKPTLFAFFATLSLRHLMDWYHGFISTYSKFLIVSAFPLRHIKMAFEALWSENS